MRFPLAGEEEMPRNGAKTSTVDARSRAGRSRLRAGWTPQRGHQKALSEMESYIHTLTKRRYAGRG